MPSKDMVSIGTKLKVNEKDKLVEKANAQGLSVCAALRALTRAWLNDEIKITKDGKIGVDTHK